VSSVPSLISRAEEYAKGITALGFLMLTAGAPQIVHSPWAPIVTAAIGAVNVWLVPNRKYVYPIVNWVDDTQPNPITQGVSMTDPSTPATDPYAGARAMGVSGVPPLPEKPKEDTPEIAELKAQIARLTGNPAEPVPAPFINNVASRMRTALSDLTEAPSLAERVAGTVSNPFSAPGVSVTPAAAAPAAGVAPDNFINNVASRMRTALSDLTQIVEDLEANGVKF
jgi:hypothetical protein